MSEEIKLEIEPPVTQVAEPMPAPPCRTVEQIRAAIKANKGATALTKDEASLLWKANKEGQEAEELRDANAQKRYWGFFTKISQSLAYKILSWLVYIIWSLIPLAGIVVGIMRYADEYCPAETSIAPLLIALGVMSLVAGVSAISENWKGMQKKPEESPGEEPGVSCGPLTCLANVLKLVHVIVFIVACVIVFSLYHTVEYERTESNGDVYCDSLLYRFGFWSLASSFLVIGATILFGLFGCCGFFVYMCFCS